MKIQELIELLLQFDKGLEVIIEGKDWPEHIDDLQIWRPKGSEKEYVLIQTREDSSL